MSTKESGIEFHIESVEGKRAVGRLRWTDRGLDSAAVSGPYGDGYLPRGEYSAPRAKLVDDHGPNDSYCDKKGKCWFQALAPGFVTPRTGLGIHPDGNVSGTEGCIGITDADTSKWYMALYAVKEQVRVLVT